MSAVRLAESIGGGFYRYDESDGKVARPYIALPAAEFEELVSLLKDARESGWGLENAARIDALELFR